MLAVILSPIIFILIKWLCFFIIEKKEWVPEFINYKPFNCTQCCSFWLNLFISISLTYWFLPYFYVYIIITVADAVAYIVDRRENTRSVNDFDN